MTNRNSTYIFLFILLFTIGCSKPVKVLDNEQMMPSGGDINFRNNDTDKYLINVITELSNTGYLPDKEWDEKIYSVVLVQILKNGTIDNLAFEIYSGNEEFNSYVIRAINMANPLPAFPSNEVDCLEIGIRYSTGILQ